MPSKPKILIRNRRPKVILLVLASSLQLLGLRECKNVLLSVSCLRQAANA